MFVVTDLLEDMPKLKPFLNRIKKDKLVLLLALTSHTFTHFLCVLVLL